MHNATCSPSPPGVHHTLRLHHFRWGGTARRAAQTSTGRASCPTSARRRQRSWRPRGCAPAWRRRGAPRNRPAHRVELKEQHPQAACGWRGFQQARRPPEGGWRCIASDKPCNWPERKASPLEIARAQQQGVHRHLDTRSCGDDCDACLLWCCQQLGCFICLVVCSEPRIDS